MAAMIDHDMPRGTTQFLYPQMQDDIMRTQGPHISRAFDLPPSLRLSGKTDIDLANDIAKYDMFTRKSTMQLNSRLVSVDKDAFNRDYQ